MNIRVMMRATLMTSLLWCRMEKRRFTGPNKHRTCGNLVLHAPGPQKGRIDLPLILPFPLHPDLDYPYRLKNLYLRRLNPEVNHRQVLPNQMVNSQSWIRGLEIALASVQARQESDLQIQSLPATLRGECNCVYFSRNK